MNQKLSIELKKGETFRIMGKKKKYLIEDIFQDYLSITIYYRLSGAAFSKIKLCKDVVVIVY